MSEIVNTAKSCDFSIVPLWCQSKGEAENLLHLEEPDLSKSKKGGLEMKTWLVFREKRRLRKGLWRQEEPEIVDRRSGGWDYA